MSSIINALFFKYVERLSYQAVSFVISLVLARLLSPEEYGILGILLIFTNLANLFVQCGLKDVLIQRLDITQKDYSTVFWMSLGLSTLFYACIFILSPLIGAFYNIPDIDLYLRILALILFPGSLNSIQLAIISRQMRFDIELRSSVIASIFSGFVGIILAYFNFGIWALIAQQLASQVLVCIIVGLYCHWLPSLHFSLKRFKVLFSSGWKLLCSGLINSIYNDIRSLLVGKKYDVATLGVYQRGDQFPRFVVNNIDGALSSVLLPYFSKSQQDYVLLKSNMRRAMIDSAYLIFPMMAGLFVVSEPLVRAILTEKWLPCVPYLQALCIAYAFVPISTANTRIYVAIGRADIYLKLEIIKKTIGLVLVLVTVYFFSTPVSIAYCAIVANLISMFVNAIPNLKILKYSILDQLIDLIPSIILSIVMAVCVSMLGFFISNTVLLLSTQILCGVLVYWCLSAVFNIKAYNDLKALVLNLLMKRNKVGV